MINGHTIYEIIRSAIGLPQNEYSMVTADTPEKAAEVVRILLSCNDESITWIKIVVHPKL